MARILVIDDSSVIRNLLEEYLCEQGHQVDLAEDGQIGIDKALSHDYQLVFCDIHMPRKNGYQVYKEVSSAKPAMPFIMTDSLPDDLAEQAEKAGARCCLTKPFDLEEVRQTISKVLTASKTV
ncbi:MAG: response regulator [Candidatus Zixiibacteriota bacterium]